VAGSIGDLLIRLGLNSQGLEQGLGKAKGTLGSFASSITAGVGSGVVALGSLAAAAAVAGAAIAGAGAIAGVGFGVKLAGEADGEAEQARVAFGVMLGSGEKAKAMLAELNQFAAETPFETGELTGAARQLLAMGVNADKVIPSLRAIGDVSAGIGAPIGEIAYLFGQVRSQGRLMGDDLRQFAGRGIPIIAALAKQFGVAEEEVKDLVSEGKVGFNQLAQAFMDMTGEGGAFSGMMEKQSQTLFGKWSTLVDNFKMALTSIGDAAIDGLNIKGLIDEAARFGDWLRTNADSLRPVFAKAGEGLWALVDVVVVLGETIGRALAGSSVSFADLMAGVGDTRKQVLDLIQASVQGIAAVIDWARVTGTAFKRDVAAPVADLVAFLSRQTMKLLAIASAMPDSLGGDEFRKGAIQAAKWSVQASSAANAMRALADVEGKMFADDAAQAAVGKFFDQVRNRSHEAGTSVGKLRREAVDLRDAVTPAQSLANAIKQVNDSAFKGIGAVELYGRQVAGLREQFEKLGGKKLPPIIGPGDVGKLIAETKKELDGVNKLIAEGFKRRQEKIGPREHQPDRPIRSGGLFDVLGQEGKTLGEQLEKQKALEQQLLKLEKQRIEAAKALTAEVVGQNKSPLERFRSQFADLADAAKNGGLGMDDFALAAARAFAELEKLNQSKFELPQALLQGSAEEVSFRNRFQAQGDRVRGDAQARVEQILREQKQIQAEQLAAAKELLKALQKAQPVKVTP
jgi:tape measure domain-containing protein